MITILIILALFLSILSSLSNKQYAAVLFMLFASTQMSAQSSSVVLAILFTSVFHFLRTFFSGKKDKRFLSITLLPIIYLIFIYILQPHRTNIFYVYYYAGYLTALFIFAWIALIKWDDKKISKFLIVYITFLVLSGFIEKIATDAIRVGSILTVATAYAVVLVVAWTIWLVNVFLNKMHNLGVILIVTFFVFTAIILSGTRMGLLGMFMGLGLCGILFVFQKYKNASIFKMFASSVSVIVLLIALSFAAWKILPNDLFIKKTFSTLISGKLDKSNTGRIYLWAFAVEAIQKNKVWGIGPGNFPAKYNAFLTSLNINKPVGTNTHAHNIYLIMISEHGFIGFGILLLFAIFCLYRAFLYFLKNRDSTAFYSLLSGFIIMAILGLVDAIPMYLPTVGFAAWFFGVSASFKNEKEIC